MECLYFEKKKKKYTHKEQENLCCAHKFLVKNVHPTLIHHPHKEVEKSFILFAHKTITIKERTFCVAVL